MDQLLLITASVALIGLTILWTIRPLLRGAEIVRERTPEARALAELSIQHEISLKNLRDLDGDYAGGKLADDDYHTQRGVLVSEGVAVLQRIDAIRARMAASDPDLDRQIEEAVKARRAVTEVSPAKPLCPACGAQVRAGARFCDQCGAAIPTLTPAPSLRGEGGQH